MAPLFDIVFRGDIVAGHSIQDVKARLGQLFKVDAPKVDALFAGGAVPLKRNVDQATAEKYKAVLTKAGAQVQVRPADTATKSQVKSAARPVPQTAAQVQPQPKQGPSPAGRDRDQTPTLSSSTSFSLAPAGSNLLSPSETRQVPARNLDLSAISIKPMEGDLLEASEKPPVVSADIQVIDYGVAEAGADLLAGFRREELPLPEVDPDFDLAEIGADLLEIADRQNHTTVDVDTSHLDVLPLEDDSTINS